MGTYDRADGYPRHDPAFDADPPCAVCGMNVDDCKCPECQTCGSVGCPDHRPTAKGGAP